MKHHGETRDVANKYLAKIEKYPVYLAINEDLGEQIHPLWLDEIALAVAQIYVGYRLGEQIVEVGQAVKQVLVSLANLIDEVTQIFKRLDKILEAIQRAIEIIGQQIERSAIKTAMGRAKGYAILTCDECGKINKLFDEGYSINDPKVQKSIDNMEHYNKEMFIELYSIINRGLTDLTPADFIVIAPLMRTWASNYGVLNNYLEPTLQTSIFDTTQHKVMKSFVRDFFSRYISLRPIVQDMLTNTYRTPIHKQGVEPAHIYEFHNGRFIEIFDYEPPPIPPRDHRLLERRTLFLRNSDYVVQASLSSNINTLTDVRWLPIKDDNYNKFPFPELVKQAREWYFVCLPKQVECRQFLYDTKNFDALLTDAMGAMSPTPKSI